VFQTIHNTGCCQSLRLRKRLVAGGSIRKRTGKFDNFSQPATVSLLLEGQLQAALAPWLPAIRTFENGGAVQIDGDVGFTLETRDDTCAQRQTAPGAAAIREIHSLAIDYCGLT
jgi:hypothetical protein